MLIEPSQLPIIHEAFTEFKNQDFFDGLPCVPPDLDRYIPRFVNRDYSGVADLVERLRIETEKFYNLGIPAKYFSQHPHF